MTGHSSPDLGIHELELMHHYHECVCFSLSGQPSVQRTWQSAIPKEALSHSGLMHGVLALAALHRSCLDRSAHDRYRLAAMRHQNLSIASLRSLIINASAENCNALFVLSTFAVIFVFALPQSPIAPTELDTFKEMITIIELTKGVWAVAEMTRSWLLQGPLRLLLLPGVWEVRLELPEDIGNALNCLLLKNHTLMQSDYRRATYDTAIMMLRQAFEILALNPYDHGVGLLWAASMERQYMDLLKAKEPMALVLLAHFGVVLHASRESWWSGNWGCRLVKAVHDLLNDHWRSLIHWPMISVGLCTDALPVGSCVPSSIFCHRHTDRLQHTARLN
jgi:hypothetical protein